MDDQIGETKARSPSTVRLYTGSKQSQRQTAQWVITIKIIGENNVRAQISTSTTRFMADATKVA